MSKINWIKVTSNEPLNTSLSSLQAEVESTVRGKRAKPIKRFYTVIKLNYVTHLNTAIEFLGSFFTIILVIFLWHHQGLQFQAREKLCLHRRHLTCLHIIDPHHSCHYHLCPLHCSLHCWSSQPELVCNIMEEPHKSEFLTFISPMVSQQFYKNKSVLDIYGVINSL